VSVAWDVVLLTHARAPEIDEDDVPVGHALTRRGLRWTARPWDARFDWSTTRLAVIRSTWDYSRRRALFLRTLARIASATALINPLDVVRRNTEKSYLTDLAGRGVPVVPTLLLVKGETRDLDDLLEERGWDRAVVKPAVSAGSWRTFRVTRGERSAAARDARRLIVARDSLVQPFLDSVTAQGERALMFFDGGYSHAIRKRSLFESKDVAPRVEVEATGQELAVARDVLRAEGADALAYARVDLSAGSDGKPLLMELEVTEPRLFFQWGPPEAAERFAEALAARLPAQ